MFNDETPTSPLPHHSTALFGNELPGCTAQMLVWDSSIKQHEDFFPLLSALWLIHSMLIFPPSDLLLLNDKYNNGIIIIIQMRNRIFIEYMYRKSQITVK